MNNKLAKWGEPFECPSETQQLGEASINRETIRQSAEIKQTAFNGKNRVAFAQIGQFINISDNRHLMAQTEEFLKQWLPALPNQEMFLVSWLRSLPQPRIKNAIKELIRISLIMFLDNHTATANFLGTSRQLIRYRFPKFTRS